MLKSSFASGPNLQERKSQMLKGSFHFMALNYAKNPYGLNNFAPAPVLEGRESRNQAGRGWFSALPLLCGFRRGESSTHSPHVSHTPMQSSAVGTLGACWAMAWRRLVSLEHFLFIVLFPPGISQTTTKKMTERGKKTFSK